MIMYCILLFRLFYVIIMLASVSTKLEYRDILQNVVIDKIKPTFTQTTGKIRKRLDYGLQVTTTTYICTEIKT